MIIKRKRKMIKVLKKFKLISKVKKQKEEVKVKVENLNIHGITDRYLFR